MHQTAAKPLDDNIILLNFVIKFASKASKWMVYFILLKRIDKLLMWGLAALLRSPVDWAIFSPCVIIKNLPSLFVVSQTNVTKCLFKSNPVQTDRDIYAHLDIVLIPHTWKCISVHSLEVMPTVLFPRELILSLLHSIIYSRTQLPLTLSLSLSLFPYIYIYIYI